MQLETLLLNPGVKVAMVTVMYDEKFTEPAALAELFGFRTAKLSSSTKYVYQMEKALAKVWELYPDAKHVVVLEEEVIVGPDFLYFLGQCLPAVDQDDSLIGVSAWNENGYEGSSGLRSLVYRTETFPGLGFLLKRSFYDLNMKDNMAKCCLKRSWDGWFVGSLGEHEMVVPDVSRVYRRPYEGLSEQADMLTELFNRPRLTNLDAAPALTNVGELGRSAYEASVRALVTASTALATTNVADCLEGRGLGFYVPEVKGKVYTVFFEQSGASDHSVLSLLARCFHLYYVKGRPSRGLHNAMLRFSYKENTMLFIGSASPYYKHMPEGYKPVTRKS
jgi:beta-1,2-N-acetylglucosaminyltransferase